MDVGFAAVEHVLGEVHAERTLGVDQCIRARRAASAKLAQQRGLPAHTRPPLLQRGVQEVPQARMNVGFAAVEHMPGKVHAERTFGVDQHIRARRAAPAELAQRRGLPAHTRPPLLQRGVQEIPQARMDIGFAAVEHVLGEVHAERTFGVDQRLHARRAASAKLAQQRGLPAHTRPPRLQRGVQEVPQARMDVGFITVEHVPGEVHAELALGVDQCIRARRTASAKLAQQRGLPAHTRPPRLQRGVQEIPQARMDVGFAAVEHMPGKVHAERTFGVDQRLRARRAAAAKLAQQRGLPAHTRPPRLQRGVQEVPQARMDVGFITVEHVPGEVHAELALGVDQCIRARRTASAKLAQQRGLPAHTRPSRSQRRVQEIPQARVDVGFVAVEHVLGEVHAELVFGVDQCIRARRAAPAELAQQRGLPEHTRPPRSQRGVQEVPQARMDVGFAAVEPVPGKVHAERTFGVDQRVRARRLYSAAYRRFLRRGWT